VLLAGAAAPFTAGAQQDAAASASSAASTATTPPTTLWPGDDWAESTPEAQGMHSAALARLVDFGAAQGMDSLLVTRHGSLVAEAFYAPYREGLKHAVNSTTKGVVATLTGMAIQDGLIASRDAPVLGFFADRKVANADASKKAMALGHLLDMTSGLHWIEPLSDAVPETMLQLGRARDWQGFVLDRPMAQAPGAGFNYNSGNTHLLSAILAQKTGGSTLAYAQKRLFGPLGITDVRWKKDPQGLEVGGWGLYLHPRDMARIGYLYLRRGQWNGRQLLPAAWVEQVFNPVVDMGFGSAAPAFKYANGWWSIPSKRAYFTAGFNRQLIVVLPDIDVVVAVTGRRHYPLPAFIDLITAAVRSREPLPADPAAQDQLAERIRQAGVEKPSASPATTPELAATVSRKAWLLERNALGIQRLVLDLTPANPRYEVRFDPGRPDLPREPVTGPLGLDGLYRTAPQGPNAVIAVKGHWLDAQSFQLISRSVADGEVTVATLRFEGGGAAVNVELENNWGFKGQVRGRAGE
jgi:CubicO group peptidase (beta-lactamase class C family)